MNQPTKALPTPAKQGTKALPSPRDLTHFGFLDGLRGLTALYVVVYHFVAWVPSILPKWITHVQKAVSFGHVAVAIFIVLSGFSLMLPVVRSPGAQLRGGIRGYMMRRVRRIMPPYYGAVFLAIGVIFFVGKSATGFSVIALSPTNILAHLLLIHNLSLPHALNLNMAHWSVAAEWQIYFLFPSVLLPVWRRLGRAAMVATGFMVAAMPLLFLPRPHNLAWTCPWYTGLFALGAAVAAIDPQAIRGRGRQALLTFFGIVCGLYLFVHFLAVRSFGPALWDTQSHSYVNFSKDAIAGSGVGAILLYCVASLGGGRYGGIAQRRPREDLSQTQLHPLKARDSSTANHAAPLLIRALEARPLVALGAMSYSLYLTHCSVLDVCLWTSDRFQLAPVSAFMWRTFAGVPVAVGLAYLFHLTFERPFQVRRSAVAPA